MPTTRLVKAVTDTHIGPAGIDVTTTLTYLVHDANAVTTPPGSDARLHPTVQPERAIIVRHNLGDTVVTVTGPRIKRDGTRCQVGQRGGRALRGFHPGHADCPAWLSRLVADAKPTLTAVTEAAIDALGRVEGGAR